MTLVLRRLVPLFGLCAALFTTAQTQPGGTGNKTSGYAPAQTCAGCHRGIWETYLLTGMGRSFYRPTVENTLANWKGPYYHAPSNSYFSMLRRGGKFYQRRHQSGPDGRETNVMEKQIDFIMGSGNHARTFLHRSPRNTLIELPLGWYADKGGHWAMNPGYDRPDHEGFRRKVSYDCMFCHNGYPQIPEGNEQPFAEPVYLDPLPGGIDCQRCHGPGSRHNELAGSGKATAEAIRSAIVNPARLTPERREEVCIQCHLETTSFPLPNSLQRYDRGPFDFRPGQPLSNDWLFFDHAPGSGREDKFEIVNAVYRIRRSRCFLESKGAFACTTCHNPHDAPRGEKAVRHYDAACRTCHGEEFSRAVAAGRHTSAGGCADCHMPKRRTEDVVHSLATDHLIQRHKPARDLLTDRAERHETGDRAYRGEVVLYYPADLAPSPTRELYTALAQVIDRSNLEKGIPRLAGAIQRFPFARPEFYFQLGEALRNNGREADAVPVYREAIRRNPLMVAAHQNLGVALRRAGKVNEAVETLRHATGLAPNKAELWHELGLTDHAQGKLAEATKALQKAIALDADLPEPHGNLGIVLLSSGDPGRAEAAFREAIRIQPDFADAHGNLANLLSGKGDLTNARRHFETALKLKPKDAAMRYNFAVALGKARDFDEAQRQLETALESDPALADAHELLANLLMARNQAAAALPHYRAWVRLQPASPQAQFGLGSALAMTGDRAAAIPYLQRAATDGDAATREAAARLLRELGVSP
ncbi:MAG: tetratricopeptide repeat protein [Acidobacteria bacterium]|nr:tetratricopeptide repeat protein [Acidobacteriota bacterium]